MFGYHINLLSSQRPRVCKHSNALVNLDISILGPHWSHANGPIVTTSARCFWLTVAMFAAVAPEIAVETRTVHAGLGRRARLVCHVHGQPEPEVRRRSVGKFIFSYGVGRRKGYVLGV